MTATFGTVLKEWRGVRNRFLGAAGYAPIYEAHEPNSAAMAPIAEAIEWTLNNHDPFPAVVLDRHWNVINANRAATTMFALLGLDVEVNMLEAFVEDDGVRRKIVNWPEVGYFLLTRLRTESAAFGGDPVLDAAIAKLGSDEAIGPPIASPLPPALPAIFDLDGTIVSLLSTIAQFGSAEDMALADQRIELFFPADEPTKALLLAAAG